MGGISGLWRKTVFSSAKPRKLAFATDDTSRAAISRQEDRLAYVVQRSDANIWRVDLHGSDRIAGSPFQFISSTRMEFHPAFSPDGKKIAFASTRSGTEEIWVCDSDGANSAPLTSFGRGTVKGPKWSPDSRNIVFWASPGGNSDASVISAKGGVPRRLTTGPASQKWPCWSGDGQSIYFVYQPQRFVPDLEDACRRRQGVVLGFAPSKRGQGGCLFSSAPGGRQLE